MTVSKNIFVSAMLIFLSLGVAGCFDARGKDSGVSLRKIGDVRLYTFLTDDQIILRGAQPYILSPDVSLGEALSSLGNHLAETYFAQTYTNTTTHIRFDVQRIEEVPVSHGSFKIAVINMVDENQFAMKQFFQGSTGAQTTLSILACTFMQPHLEDPLLDGLILLYNGEILPELDHIDLSGILTPGLFRHIAMRAIHHTRTKKASRTLESGAPRAGARGTFGAALPAEAPVLLRRCFGGHPHSSTARKPWLPAEAGEEA